MAACCSPRASCPTGTPETFPVAASVLLADCRTLADIAPAVGSYPTAHALATAGLFGDPVATVGRTKLYSARVVDAALAERAKGKTRRRAS
jgi:hypothetical protein